MERGRDGREGGGGNRQPIVWTSTPPFLSFPLHSRSIATTIRVTLGTSLGIVNPPKHTVIFDICVKSDFITDYVRVYGQTRSVWQYIYNRDMVQYRNDMGGECYSTQHDTVVVNLERWSEAMVRKS